MKTKRFHNGFLIEKFISEESIPVTDANLSKVMMQVRKNRPNDKELQVADNVLRDLIEMAKAELSIAKDKVSYGKQLDGLYIAQGIIARLLTAD
jgi:FKBP-type peptidyl-prolyl cis-trans isomerase (trigger factor)